MPAAQRSLPSWQIEETDACFIVCDANGRALAYGGEAGTPRGGQVPTRDEARRIAANIAKLPESLRPKDDGA